MAAPEGNGFLALPVSILHEIGSGRRFEPDIPLTEVLPRPDRAQNCAVRGARADVAVTGSRPCLTIRDARRAVIPGRSGSSAGEGHRHEGGPLAGSTA